MAKAEQTAGPKEGSAPESDHTETIKSQILEQAGRPPRLHHVEVCRHHNDNYRVNVWEKRDTTGDSAFSTSVHIGASYYLKVSHSGEITCSNPPLTKRRFSS